MVILYHFINKAVERPILTLCMSKIIVLPMQASVYLPLFCVKNRIQYCLDSRNKCIKNKVSQRFKPS